MARLWIMVSFILLFPVCHAHAHDAAEVRAARVSDAPVIDGKLDDTAWAAAPEITGFTQRDPIEGTPASEKTTVRIVYDDEAIYFGVLLEDRFPITSRLGRRDTFIDSDYLTIALDPLHDHRSGAAFSVNPANVQSDSVLVDDSGGDNSWDAVWVSATRVVPGGWAAEVKIPFSQLRFAERDVHIWGVNFMRDIVRNREHSRLVHTPRQESGLVSRFAHLVGLEGIRARRNLEILPYLVGRSDFRRTVASADPFNERSESSADAGLDIEYSLASHLKLTAAINPDFGQVELDPAQVNLTQFETFYAERRPFFVEGADLFAFGRGGSNWYANFNFSPPSLFYSRRIGREPQGNARLFAEFRDAPSRTSILGAGKITGKTASGWSVAVLDAVTSEEHATFTSAGGSEETVVVEPLTNYFAARVAKDLGRRGRAGAFVSSVTRDAHENLAFLKDDAVSGGVDGYWFFGERDVLLEGFVAGSLVRGNTDALAETQRSAARYFQRPDAGHIEYDPTRTSLSGSAARLTVVKQTGTWRYNLEAQRYSPGFETNDAGFMQRTDITATHAALRYDNRDTGTLLRNRTIIVAKHQNWNTAGDLISNGLVVDAAIDFRSYWRLGATAAANFERFDDRLTRGGPLVRYPRSHGIGFNVSSDSRKPLSFRLSTSGNRNVEGGNSFNTSLAATYRPTSSVTVSLTPSYVRSHNIAQYVRTVDDATASATYGRRYVFANVDLRTFELATRLDWTFTPRLSLQFYVQPLLASGDYRDFKELASPRTFDYSVYGKDIGAVRYAGSRYFVDPDGGGPAAEFSFGDPDLNVRSLRGSSVLRWEFRPGSAVFLVWNQNRADNAPEFGRFDVNHDISRLSRAPADDVFLLKVSWWLPM